jgi:uncharacterized membrane protein YhaH (DUF805 family)
MIWFIRALKKYATFSGRARRREFWMFQLCTCLIAFAISVISVWVGVHDDLFAVKVALLYLLLLLPTLAVTVRRLHDTGRSGWYLFVTLVPIGGAVAFLIFVAQGGVLGTNEYGPDPKMAEV